MTNSNQFHKVIILDDDDRYVKPQLDLAYTKFNIELVHFTNWEEAKSELESNIAEYQAIIVDGKGQLSKDDKVEDDAHLNVVLTWLMEQKGRGKYLPIFINTGFHEEISKYYKPKDSIIGVYKKGENQTFQLFADIVSTITKYKTHKYEMKYESICALFNDTILPKSKKEILLDCLLKVESGSIQRSDFNSIRELLELVYKKLKDVNLLPSEFFPGNKVTMEWCYRYLCGLQVDGPDRKAPSWNKKITDESMVSPPHIQYSLFFVKECCSTLSHEYSYSFSNNTFNAITFSMIEILIWFKEYVKLHKQVSL